MLNEQVLPAVLADLKDIKDVWENNDSSLSILFCESGMKSKICENDILNEHFESRHGFREYCGDTIVYIGVLTLFEGLAHLYVPAIRMVEHG
jgi:hypothetical protein